VHLPCHSIDARALAGIDLAPGDSDSLDCPAYWSTRNTAAMRTGPTTIYGTPIGRNPSHEDGVRGLKYQSIRKRCPHASVRFLGNNEGFSSSDEVYPHASPHRGRR
jgi:hypothetical protein